MFTATATDYQYFHNEHLINIVGTATRGASSFREVKEYERFRGGVPIGTPHKIIVKSDTEIAENRRS
jgi:hypothetical protein